MEKVATMASGATRAPQQKRSRASYERMLNAAEKLLISRGSDDFTLTDVSKAGKVSIGSIYCRFDSKDELIHTVHNQVMDRLLAEEALLIEAIRNNARNLATLIPELSGPMQICSTGMRQSCDL
jgi:AcrR family transcriptional regulator